jgi:asparagine synthase (glutamine-hydrolysing)
MCGIAGVLDWRGFPGGEAAVSNMVNAMRHRGPDAQITKSFGPVIFGHARLSVIDLSERANQPMFDGDGQLLIVYNGEIYNFPEIRRELKSRGISFRTSSDTEVILEGYKLWGDDILRRLNGMFAFVIWDGRQQRLIMARDRFGKKPLHYFLTDNGLVFASELQALLYHPQCPRDISLPALRRYLALGYTLTSAPILDQVQRLAPAHVLVVDRNGVQTPQCYWNYADCFRTKKHYKAEADAIAELEVLVRDAVRIRMIADVPLGAFLSGGIDSSLLAACMSADRKGQINTFSIGFSEKGFDESADARRIAAFLGTTHHDRVVYAEAADRSMEILSRSDEPFADTSFIPTALLSQFARSMLTVSLSGDGGDEMFLGYETYAADRLAKWIHAVPSGVLDLSRRLTHLIPASFGKVGLDEKARRFFSGVGCGFHWGHYSWRLNFDDADLFSLLAPDLRPLIAGAHPFAEFDRFYQDVAGLDIMDQAAYVDAKTWLADDILVKTDRASMLYSLEVRAPYLDYRIAEFAASLPVALKLKGLRKKYILRQLHTRHFPKNLRPRRKRGFNAPLSHWLRGPMKDGMRAATDALRTTGWFDKTALETVWIEHEAGHKDNGQKLLCLASLGLWLSKTARTPAHIA